ncbi:hypothetical protein GCM10011583_16220 [Streptomyces camponoticapitis]|uniref:Uncharacterized protein n=1 Tax=Streptomyces camponoticapitis TaxID=1616125 RepID=A0ABQ2E1M5_9ACTN|nr:hypothetical protein GCM10011583_16220 [Streptomyces camponoticapitis]
MPSFDHVVKAVADMVKERQVVEADASSPGPSATICGPRDPTPPTPSCVTPCRPGPVFGLRCRITTDPMSGTPPVIPLGRHHGAGTGPTGASDGPAHGGPPHKG